MEILKRFSLLLLVGLTTFISCKKFNKNQDNPEQLCKEMCSKIAKCSAKAEKMAKSKGMKGANAKKTARMFRFFKNEKQCNSSCLMQAKEKEKKGKVNFFTFFLKKQKECLKLEGCTKFSACRSSMHTKAIFDYPLDEVQANRCEKVCSRIHKCAQVIVPRVYGDKYKRLPLDKQAELVKKRANKQKCLHSCRYNFIKRSFVKKDKKTIYLAPSEAFIKEFSKYLNCIGFKDCGAFVDCAIKQQ